MSRPLSSERRQAATPKHTVSMRAVASNSTDKNWLTSPPAIGTLARASMERRFGKCRGTDARAVFPKHHGGLGWLRRPWLQRARRPSVPGAASPTSAMLGQRVKCGPLETVGRRSSEFRAFYESGTTGNVARSRCASVTGSPCTVPEFDPKAPAAANRWGRLFSAMNAERPPEGGLSIESADLIPCGNRPTANPKAVRRRGYNNRSEI